MKQLLGYFWRGCLVLLPVVVTAYVAYFVVALFDRLVPLGIPGLGLVVVVALVTVVGFLTSNVLGHAAVNTMEKWLGSLPLLKLIYGSIRDLVQAFVGNKKRFDQAVAVRLAPESAIQLLGFVTRDSLAVLGKRDHVAVYVPQSYNFAGNVLVVPREQVEPLQVSSSDLMAFIVSGGVSGLGVDLTPAQAPIPAKRTMFGLGPRAQG